MPRRLLRARRQIGQRLDAHAAQPAAPVEAAQRDEHAPDVDRIAVAQVGPAARGHRIGVEDEGRTSGRDPPVAYVDDLEGRRIEREPQVERAGGGSSLFVAGRPGPGERGEDRGERLRLAAHRQFGLERERPIPAVAERDEEPWSGDQRGLRTGGGVAPRAAARRFRALRGSGDVPSIAVAVTAGISGCARAGDRGAAQAEAAGDPCRIRVVAGLRERRQTAPERRPVHGRGVPLEPRAPRSGPGIRGSPAAVRAPPFAAPIAVRAALQHAVRPAHLDPRDERPQPRHLPPGRAGLHDAAPLRTVGQGREGMEGRRRQRAGERRVEEHAGSVARQRRRGDDGDPAGESEEEAEPKRPRRPPGHGDWPRRGPAPARLEGERRAGGSRGRRRFGAPPVRRFRRSRGHGASPKERPPGGPEVLPQPPAKTTSGRRAPRPSRRGRRSATFDLPMILADRSSARTRNLRRAVLPAGLHRASRLRRGRRSGPAPGRISSSGQRLAGVVSALGNLGRSGSSPGAPTGARPVCPAARPLAGPPGPEPRTAVRDRRSVTDFPASGAALWGAEAGGTGSVPSWREEES